MSLARGILPVLLAVALLSTGCTPPVPVAENSASSQATAAPPENPTDIKLLRALSNAGVTPVASLPEENKELMKLGRALMFGKDLSGNRDIACATCHDPNRGTGDGLSLSVGTGGVVARNAPPLFNLALAENLFWDGRIQKGENGPEALSEKVPYLDQVDSLLAVQAAVPLTCRVEMLGEGDLNGHLELLLGRVERKPEYQTLLMKAYPGVPESELRFYHLANALAAFQRGAYRSFGSPFDQFLEGDDRALTLQQKRGALLFYGRAKCSGCHRGIMLSDFRFHNVAVPQIGPGKAPHQPLDLGRAGITGKPSDRFRFRTPSLRNVELTGPWMHDGAYTSLRAVVEHYRDPGKSLTDYDKGQLSPELSVEVHVEEQLREGVLETLDPIVAQSLELSEQEVDDLLAFLGALSDPRFAPSPEP